MIVKLFTQLVLVGTLFQMFPADAGDLETLATLPQVEEQVFDLLEAYRVISRRLPEARDAVRAPLKISTTSMGVITSAQSALVLDRASGEVLYQKNISEPRSIGSITKLMTAVVFMQSNPDLDAPATISSEDLRYGARVHVPVGETIRVREVLQASLIGSDNTATAALARLSGMSLGDFVAKMNETAAQIGMQSTTFADTTGLSSKNQSIVTDIAKLLEHTLDIEIIREITQQPYATITASSGNSYNIDSTDELLESFVNQDPYKILVAKTGFLPEAGYCLGTVFSNADGNEIIVVVLGSDTKYGRFQDVKSLAVWAYDTYEWEI